MVSRGQHLRDMLLGKLLKILFISPDVCGPFGSVIMLTIPVDIPQYGKLIVQSKHDKE